VLRGSVLLILLFAFAEGAGAQGQSSTSPPASAQNAPEPNNSSAPVDSQKDSANGIFVGEPKVYDDRSLQLLLNNLRTRLGQISGLDQASLTSRIGAIQGASATTLGFSMQANGTPAPGIVTTATQATPTTTETTGGSTSTTPSSTGTTTTVTAPTGTTTTTTTTSATTATTTASNQSVVNAPGSTLSTQTTSPSVTPTPPNIANVPSFSLPSAFSPSALDVLGEQMQLSYEIINLQLLLEGSLNDQYVRGSHLMKPRTTLGFPISITAPSGDDYRNAVAEVEVTVCDPPVLGPGGLSEPPSLVTVLPREKTYNIASITNKSVSLGASGIIAGVISVGANFLWGHQTYYVVEDQDTVAVQRAPRKGVCKAEKVYDADKKQWIDAPELKPVTFAWQFRPVLGQKVVRQGLRQTFAQVAFPTYPPMKCTGTVHIRTRWLEYDAKHGIVRGEVEGSVPGEGASEIPFFFPDSLISGVTTVDNFDGTTSVTVSGPFASGTRVRVGLSYLDESTPGFQNSIGTSIRFTAADQALALYGASLVTRDGVETEIFADSGASENLPPCGPAKPPIPDPPTVSGTVERGQRTGGDLLLAAMVVRKSASTYEYTGEDSSDNSVKLKQFSDSLVQVTVPIAGLGTTKVGGPYPIVVSLGGKVFGLGDAPFKSVDDGKVTFLAPKDLVRTSRRLTVKRLFLRSVVKSYDVPAMSDFAVSGLSVVSSNKKETKYVLLGTGLDGVNVVPAPAAGVVIENGTTAFFTLSADQTDGLKQVIVKHGTDSPILVSIPEAKSTATKPQLTAHDAISPGTGVTYTIAGTMLDTVASIQYLGKQIPFSLSLDKKSLVVQLPDGMTSSAGIRSLLVTYTDGSTDRFAVAVGKTK
jgi:hypothetical protein